ncbi:MAG: DUF1638 domain-containing protein [Planctomycetaceae bacterium]|jgi:hypothetical protein|nr:DUF1638 domain-containing protein [Planctomycetaceae bacterium]
MRLKLFACEILFRELCSLAAVSLHRIDLEFLPKGLHDIGKEKMSNQLTEALAAVNESDYDAVLLGYALCSGGITGLKARTIPLVVPRAHDCITLFLGSRYRYRDYFFANSGTYFKTTGWLERSGDSLSQLGEWNTGTSGIPSQMGMNMSKQELAKRYGQDNGEYLYEQLTKMKHYSKLAFIETGVEPNDSFEQQTQELAEQKNWQYEKLQGDLTLLRKLVNGNWDDDFLVVLPGQRIDFSYDDDIINAL